MLEIATEHPVVLVPPMYIQGKWAREWGHLCSWIEWTRSSI